MSRYSDILLSSIFILTSLGLVMVFSAGSNPALDSMSGLSLFIKQFIWVIIGSLFLIVCSFMNYKKISFFSYGILFFAIFIAILAYFTKPSGESTARSLYVFGKSVFQTSEIVKIALIIFTASFISNNKRKISDFNFMSRKYYPYFCLSVMVLTVSGSCRECPMTFFC